MTDGTPGNIVLVGFMGSGKSEVGRALAHQTGRDLLDLDAVVEAEGRTIPEIFAAEGEKGFRRREKAAVRKAAQTREAVIATGGGAVLDPENVRELKKSGVVVYLQASRQELLRRLEGSTDRPLLASREGPAVRTDLRKRVDGLLDAREPVYESVADHVVRCDGRRPAQVAGEIASRLAPAPASTVRRVRVPVDPPYWVVIGRGLLGGCHEHLKVPKGAEQALVVSHPRIRRLWGSKVEQGLRRCGLRVSWCTFPEGEDKKDLDTVAKLARALARNSFHRSDLVVALGGGVVGDVGGYVASVYARGIAVVQMPTTLLAMVDASIGGKTGVNLPQGKNLVGTFHQPYAVVADPDVLGTLPERELRGGLAEVIKYGFISDPPMAELVVRRAEEIFGRGQVLDKIVLRCARIKAKVVGADERDLGVRAVLNYGHTLGHAIESLSIAPRRGGTRLHHGEAISIGMVFAAVVARRMGYVDQDLVDEHRYVLSSVGLPTSVEGVGWSEVRERMKVDKKYGAGDRLVLLEAKGKPIVEKVPQKVLSKAFAEVTS